MCFHVSFEKFSRTPFFIENLCWLILQKFWFTENNKCDFSNQYKTRVY